MPYPLLMRPYYRHGTATPWGGTGLHTLFGRELPDEHTGESLEISALAAASSVVSNGRLAGAKLADIARDMGADLTGAQGAFPLMAKWIDARDMLSVQVHPGDDYAKARHGKLGKTEAWLVLHAEPGAKLCYGLKENCAPFEALCADGHALTDALRFVEVTAGDVLYIPHGLIHALGDGICVYEIQQSSDVTYRISDWGRMGLDGKPRELHLADAKAVVREALRPQKTRGVRETVEGGARTAYVCDTNFAFWGLELEGEMPLAKDRMHLLTAIDRCVLRWEDKTEQLAPGGSCVIPANCPPVMIAGKGRALLSGLPDKAEIRKAFGANAKEVAGMEDA